VGHRRCTERGAIGGRYLPIRRGLPLFLRVGGFTSILGMLKAGSKEHFDGDHWLQVTAAYDGRVRSSFTKKGLDGSGMECACSIVRMDVRHYFHVIQHFFF
jgi:hypothetical protein